MGYLLFSTCLNGHLGQHSRATGQGATLKAPVFSLILSTTFLGEHMRKLQLLATTALAGTALLAGAAQAHEGLEVTVGGYNDFQAGFYGTEQSPKQPGVATRHNDFQNEFQLDIEAKEKTKSGLEYGAVATLWNGADFTSANLGRSGGASIRTHQAYGYLNGAWGQVRAGDHHGVTDFYVAAPTTYDSGTQTDGYYTEYVSAAINPIRPHFLDNDDNSTKITYMTPKVGFGNSKVQLGVSYAPNAFYNQGQAIITTNPNTAGSTEIQNEVIGGAQYEGTFMNKVNVLAGLVVTTGDHNNGLLAGFAQNDFTSYDAGAQIGYAGFTVGGNYTDAGRFGTVKGQNRQQNDYSLGASYKFDRASFAGSYLNGRGYGNAVFGLPATVTTSSANDAAYTAYGFGAGYSLFDGMTTSVDAVFFQQNRQDTVVRDEGHVVILSNRVAF